VKIGKIEKKDLTTHFNLNLNCIDCGKKTPGGMVASTNYFGSYSFFLEIDDFKKKYLCGKCRDKKRINEKIL